MPLDPGDALLAIGVLGALFLLGPDLLELAGLRRFQVWIDPDPRLAEPALDDADGQAKYRTLVELGFEPIGLKHERIWFFCRHWRKTFDVPMLANRDRTVYACMNRFVSDEPVRVGLESFLRDGRAVETKSPGMGQHLTGDRFLMMSMGPMALPELLREHQGHVRAFAGQHGSPVAAVTSDDLPAHIARSVREQLPMVRPFADLTFSLQVYAGALAAIWLVQGQQPLGNLSLLDWGVMTCSADLLVGLYLHVFVQGLRLAAFRQQHRRQASAGSVADTDAFG